jgi:uncharacterized protein (UPF0332 family)
MTRDQGDLLVEARESISAARVLVEHGYPSYAASRAYYAMFYIAEAFLEGEGLAFSKHSAVISAFGQHFANTGRVPREFHRFLLDGQELRNLGDYGPGQAIDVEQAEEQIRRAERFLELAQQTMGPIPDS